MNKKPNPKIRLAVVGSRNITEFVILDQFGLGALRTVGFDITDVETIVSGGAKGADLLSVDLSLKYRIPHLAYIAEWIRPNGTKNKRAGFERNALIVEDCDAAIVLWDGFSSGTADALRRLQDANKPYVLVEVEMIWADKKSKRTEIALGGTYFWNIDGWTELYEKKKKAVRGAVGDRPPRRGRSRPAV